MLKKLLFVSMLGVFMGLPLAVVQAEIMHVPTEVTYYDPAKAFNGVTLFTPPGAPGKTYTYFIDMDGRLLHKMKSLGYSKFLENGRLLTAGNSAGGGGEGGGSGVIAEENWGGAIVWSAPNTFTWNAAYEGKMQPWSTAQQHHDFYKTWNNKLKAWTYMMVARPNRTAALATALGADPANAGGYNGGWQDDSIIEINSAGQIVWMWAMADHTSNTYLPGSPGYVTDLALAPGKLDINVLNAGGPVRGPKNDWIHVNSMNYNQELGLVVFNSRTVNEFWVVNHDKTFVSTTDFAANIAAAAGPDGDFMYRFGNPSNYNQGLAQALGTNGHQQIWGAHNIQWIPKTMYTGGPTLPGYPNFIIFDNHCNNKNPIIGGSELKEINPFVTGPAVNGVYPTATTYQNPPVAGYTPQSSQGAGNAQFTLSNQTVWRFRSAWITGFASAHISGIQRLPNGNTMGIAGEHGHLFEVTPTGEMVWEYACPIVANGIPQKFQYNIGTSNLTFRAHRYSVNMPGLNNRLVMYPDGTILPKVLGEKGVGFTLTGQVPCRSIPCNYVGTP
jgi:hypothetical protein